MLGAPEASQLWRDGPRELVVVKVELLRLPEASERYWDWPRELVVIEFEVGRILQARELFDDSHLVGASDQETLDRYYLQDATLALHCKPVLCQQRHKK